MNYLKAGRELIVAQALVGEAPHFAGGAWDARLGPLQRLKNIVSLVPKSSLLLELDANLGHT